MKTRNITDIQIEVRNQVFDLLDTKYEYFIENGVYFRIKDHAANYFYFQNDIDDGYIFHKIVNINYTGEGCYNETRMTLKEFKEENPQIEVVNITFDCDYEQGLPEDIKILILKFANENIRLNK